MFNIKPNFPKFDFAGKKIWVAGETGMVGRALISALQNENIEILSAPHTALDLTNQQQTLDWIKAHKPDAIIMAAAKVGGIGANSADQAGFLYKNIAMAQNVIEGAYLGGVSKLLYLGSSCIYPKNAPQPLKVESLLTGSFEPSNEGYALAKMVGIKLCAFYRAQYGCDFISALPCNLYGPHDHFDAEKSHVIPALMLKIHQAKEREEAEVILWGTGEPLREFLYVDDLARGLITLMKEYSDTAPVNIGSGKEITIQNLAEMISDVIGYEGNIIFNDNYPNGMMRKILDSSTIDQWGWQAETRLREGLQRTYDWFIQ